MKLKLMSALAGKARVITEQDILTITSHGFMVGTRKLSQEEVSQIKAEARDLKNSALWDYMQRECEFIAFVKARKATTELDTYSSNAMYYNLDLQKQFLDNLINR